MKHRSSFDPDILLDIDLDSADIWTPTLSPRLFPTCDPEKTIVQHQEELKNGIRDGLLCGCCGQNTKLYKRTINAQMAVWLLVLVRVWRKTGTWVSVSEKPLVLYHKGGDYAKLKHWGLVVSAPTEPKDDKIGSGLWTPTERGCRFVDRKLLVPSHLVFSTTACTLT